MITVWEYPIEITDEQEIEMPCGASILHAGLDPVGQACVWAEVDSNRPTQTRKVYVTGTGNPMPKYYDLYVGSFTEGSFVWHVWCDATRSMGVRDGRRN